MARDNNHPKDLSPYLDNDYSDKEYNRIQAHLSECSHCREELESIQQMEALFRAPEIQIEPSPFQWTRIAARLEAGEEPRRKRIGWVPGGLAGSWDKWKSLVGAGRLAPFSAARAATTLALVVVLGLMAVGGFQYLGYQQQNQLDRQILTMIANADLGIPGLHDGLYENNGEGLNPFRRYIEESERGNPFDNFLYPLENRSLNPFVLR